ncbi:helix-turn-helix domain-containing protein [Mycobacterium sp. 1245111.1]|uniref:helix-turn-helix domain-containing protein n=1 Tax=Mycobacterium sp. 1245111.1 TaxID=1834073 RepID=UPI000AAED70E
MPSRNLVKHHGNVREQLNAAIPMGLVRDDKLSAMAKATALEVWSHAEGRHQSTVSVAEALGINRRTATNAIAELQERGWLMREVHYGPPKDGKVPTKPAWERWHLRMTNAPWTADEMETLCTQYTAPCAPSAHLPVHPVHNIEVKGGVHEKCTPSRSEREAVHQMHSIGEGDPQRESEPDVFGESVSSSDPHNVSSIDSTPHFDAHFSDRISCTSHRIASSDAPVASLPSGSSALGDCSASHRTTDPFASAPIGTSAQEDEPQSEYDWDNPLGLNRATPTTTAPPADTGVTFDPFAD